MFKLKTWTDFADMMLMPAAVDPPVPMILKFRRVTTSVAAGALITTPLPEDTRTPPLRPPKQSIVIDFWIVTCPNPPGSRQSISPAVAVFEIAPAKVLHGAVRLHGLASS